MNQAREDLYPLIDKLMAENKRLTEKMAEAEKLLEKVLCQKKLVLPKGLINAEHRDEVYMLVLMYNDIDQALALLQEKPACETQKGSK